MIEIIHNDTNNIDTQRLYDLLIDIILEVEANANEKSA